MYVYKIEEEYSYRPTKDRDRVPAICILKSRIFGFMIMKKIKKKNI